MKQDMVTVEGEGAVSNVLGIYHDELRIQWAYEFTILTAGTQAGRVLHQPSLRPVPADLGKFDEADRAGGIVNDDMRALKSVLASVGSLWLSVIQISSKQDTSA